MVQDNKPWLSDLEERLADLDPHLTYLVARVIDAAMHLDDAGMDTAARLGALPELAELAEVVDWSLRMEVQALRAFTWWDVSWTDIGDALGISRQAARQRFRVEGDLGAIDEGVDRRQKAAEARKHAVLTRLAAEKAELDAQVAEGMLSPEETAERTQALMARGFEQLTEVAAGSMRNEADLASQAWYAVAESRLKELT